MLRSVIQYTKQTIKVPLRLARYSSSMWSGDYPSMEAARQHCDGYDAAAITEKCKAALLEVKAGRALFERDSILYHEARYSWQLLTVVQQVALQQGGKVEVLDFGGALGSLYFQHRTWWEAIPGLQWHVIDQPALMEVGRAHAASAQLHFHNDLDAFLANYRPDVLVLSGVLQYLDDPHAWVRKVVDWGIPYILVMRTALIEGTQRDVLTVQRVWKHIYDASYPSWFFDKAKLVQSFAPYEMMGNFTDQHDPDNWVNGYKATWEGFLFLKSKK